MKKRLAIILSMIIVFSMSISAIVYAGDYELPKVTVTKATTTKEHTTKETTTSTTDPIAEIVDDYDHPVEYFVGFDGYDMLCYCPECNGNVYIPAEYVMSKWHSSYVNKSPYEIDNGIIFDVVDDGIINAKDYAVILHHVYDEAD